MTTRDNSGQGGPGNKATGPLDRAQEEAADISRQGIGAAQNRIRAVFEQQSHRAADQIGSVAQALRSAAEQLEAENNGPAARYTGIAADRVEQFADTLRNSTVDDLVGQVESFARRQPEVFLGAAFGVGFLFARFIKSSGERIRMADLMRQRDEESRMGGGRGMGGGGGNGGGGRGRDTYDFSRERQNIGGSYPANARSSGRGATSGQGGSQGSGMGGGDTDRSRPRASETPGVGNTIAMGSGTRNAAELMAGGSPEPAKSANPQNKGEPARANPNTTEPVSGASTPAATLGATPAGAARTAAKPEENKP